MLLIDIGSTYTKLVVADENSKDIVATCSSPTTIEDISIGYHNALSKLEDIPTKLLKDKFACSSAAGGLRLVAIGLVPALTMEAARRAALGAGAKVIATYSYQLNRKQVSEIEDIAPDIILLAGGTNGGDKENIIHNAEKIAASSVIAPIVVAGNSEVEEEVALIFENSGKNIFITDNVMPTLSEINVISVREVIRDIFIKRIIVAKGLDKINSMINEMVLPTPLAVLEAAISISEAFEKDVVVVDVGGATTDIHSISEGLPYDSQIVLKGLPEPFAKRTVEGDLGVRHNINSIVRVYGKEDFLNNNQFSSDFCQNELDLLLQKWRQKVSSIPECQFEKDLDCALASCAVEVAMNRHAGYLEEMWAPHGKIIVQYGKDLTKTGVLIGTGGPIINSNRCVSILKRATFNMKTPLILKPENPKIYLDKKYVLYAIGLIRQVDPALSKEIVKNHINKMEVIEDNENKKCQAK